MEEDILDRQLTQLNDIDFVNVEVKYHLESQSKKYYFQSNSFFKQNCHFAWLSNEEEYIF